MEKARIFKTINALGYPTTKVIRGPLNDDDKHWGMRSNMRFRKMLKVKEK